MPQTVRPLLAPMAEAAAGKIDPALDDDERERVKALAAATDNVGLFFGEDVFIAFGARAADPGVSSRSTASRWIRAASRSGRCRRRSPRSSSTRCASPGSSAASQAAARIRRRRRRIGQIARHDRCCALSTSTGCAARCSSPRARSTLRSRRYASAAFWTILSACFFGGDAIEAAAAGRQRAAGAARRRRCHRAGADRRIRRC